MVRKGKKLEFISLHGNTLRRNDDCRCRMLARPAARWGAGRILEFDRLEPAPEHKPTAGLFVCGYRRGMRACGLCRAGKKTGISALYSTPAPGTKAVRPANCAVVSSSEPSYKKGQKMPRCPWTVLIHTHLKPP
jgi:hypothetical protein